MGMRIENRAGRVLSVVHTTKHKDGTFVVVVDTDDIREEAWQDGVQQAMEAS
jgi:hypothetical protein